MTSTTGIGEPGYWLLAAVVVLVLGLIIWRARRDWRVQADAPRDIEIARIIEHSEFTPGGQFAVVLMVAAARFSVFSLNLLGLGGVVICACAAIIGRKRTYVVTRRAELDEREPRM